MFERSLYLRSADLFVYLGEPSIGNSPLTLIADLGGARTLSDLELCPGQPASISKRRITIGGTVELTLDDCDVWRPPRWPLALLPDRLNEVYRAIARLTAAEAPEEGFGQLSCLHERGANGERRWRAWHARASRASNPGCAMCLDTHRVPITASSEPVQG